MLFKSYTLQKPIAVKKLSWAPPRQSYLRLPPPPPPTPVYPGIPVFSKNPFLFTGSNTCNNGED